MADSSSLESLLKSLPPDKLESLLKNLGYKRESEETTESSLDCTDSKLEVEEKTSDVADDVDDVDNIDVSLKFKTRGNEKFNRGDFQGAIDDYTKYLIFCVFYSPSLSFKQSACSTEPLALMNPMQLFT